MLHTKLNINWYILYPFAFLYKIEIENTIWMLVKYSKGNFFALIIL